MPHGFSISFLIGVHACRLCVDYCFSSIDVYVLPCVYVDVYVQTGTSWWAALLDWLEGYSICLLLLCAKGFLLPFFITQWGKKILVFFFFVPFFVSFCFCSNQLIPVFCFCRFSLTLGWASHQPFQKIKLLTYTY